MAEFVIGPKAGVRLARDKTGSTVHDFPHASSDISHTVRSFDFPRSRPSVEITPLGTDHTAFLKGLKGSTIAMEVNADWAAPAASAAGGSSQILEECYNADAESFLRWAPYKADEDASATNPMWDLEVLVLDFPVGGSVGEEAKHSVSMVVNKVTKKASGAFNAAFGS